MKLTAEIALVKDNKVLLDSHTSLILQNADAILSKVAQTTFDSLGARVSTAEGSIVIQAGQIASKVAQTTFDSLGARVSTAEGSIVNNANAITSKVSSTDFNGINIVSLVNQTADTYKVDAKNIKLDGIVTANSYFKIALDGSMEAMAGKIGNWNIGWDGYGIYNIVPTGAQNNNSTGLGGPNADWAIWAGDGRFRVTQEGYLYASNANISGVINASSGSFSGTIYAGSGSIGGVNFSGGVGTLLLSGQITVNGATIANNTLWVRFTSDGVLYNITREVGTGYLMAL